MNKSWKESDPEAPSSSSANTTLDETEFEPVSTTPVVDFSSFIDPFTGGLKTIKLPTIACFSAEATAERWRGFAGSLMTDNNKKTVNRKKKLKTSSKRKSIEVRRRKRANSNMNLPYKLILKPSKFAFDGYKETTDESMIEPEPMIVEPIQQPQRLEAEPEFRIPPGFKRIADDTPNNGEPPVKMSKLYFDIEDINGSDLSLAFRRVVCDNLEFWSDIADRIRVLDEKQYSSWQANRGGGVITP